MRIDRIADFYIASLTDRQTLSTNFTMIQYTKVAFMLKLTSMPTTFGVGC